MIRCAYCELYNSLECENKHKNFPNDEICKDFSLDPKRLDEYRWCVINKKIQEILIEFEDIESRQLEFLNPNNFEFADLSEYIESKGKS